MNMPLVLLNRRRRGFTAFSPSTLFSTTAIGIWLDPSDLTTMFSDRAGTTAVTTPGTVVGLRLDKSKGLTLGAELVTNGDFSGGTTGWSVTGGTQSAGSGALLLTPTPATPAYSSQSFTTVVGRSYQVNGSITAGTSSFFAIRKGDSASVGSNAVTFRSSVGVFTGVFTATATTSFLVLQANDNGSATFDNISVRELAGNHAVAPTDAARPTYGIEPKGGRRNLLTYSEQFDVTAAWTSNRIAVTANATTAPDGTQTADKIVDTVAGSNSYRIINSLTLSATSYTSTFYAKAAEYSWCYLRIGNDQKAWFNLSNGTVGTVNAGLTASITSVGNGWYRLSCTIATATAGSGFALVGLATADNVEVYTPATGGSGVFVWGAQLELGSTATNYQRVTTAYDITESGVATTHYVQYDGSDDSLSTAAIDFTGTDKMSVFAGVRKLSDAAVGVIVESSVNYGINNGAFALAAPSSAAANYGWNSRGTAFVTATTANSFSAPIANVLTGLSNIVADSLTLRINGIQAASSTGDQGTGNYGNYPLYIGRRGGTTLPFNGKDYGLIVVGKAASAGEITDTETWLADRTAQVTL